MNRYVADGILRDVEAGRTVLVVSDTNVGTRAALEELERGSVAVMAGVLTVRRSSGREEIRHRSGGRVLFTSVRSTGARGVSADVLFVDADITRDQWASLAPCIAASPVGEAMLR